MKCFLLQIIIPLNLIFAVFIKLAAAALPLDLSEDFPPSSLYNANTGSDAMISFAESSSNLYGFIVIENGEVVAEYYDDDYVSSKGKSAIWSCTKTWTSLLFGVMEEEGLISMSDRLVDIADGSFWNTVRDADLRKELSMEAILSMTAGLRLGLQYLIEIIFGLTLGGNSGLDCLEYHDIIETNINTVWEYAAVGNLLSYVIKGRTGMTPEEYAELKVFPYLGIGDSNVDWELNADDVNTAWHGMVMDVPSMAKLGQLYQQNGYINASTQIFNNDWVSRSVAGTPINPGYGLSWWNYGNNISCAIGLGEQYICFDTSGTNNRVFAATSNDDYDEDTLISLIFAYTLDFTQPSSTGITQSSNLDDSNILDVKVVEMARESMEKMREAMTV